MAERWQSAEGRAAAVLIKDSNGAPVTGLTPTAVTAYKDGTAGAPAATVTEVAYGFYRVTFASAPTKDVLVRVDGGATLTATRYVGLEVPVGGYVDNIDTTVGSRASGAAVAALGSPAQAAAVTALGSPAQDTALAAAQADLSTLKSRVTATRAALLDNLTQLDAAVSTRTPSSVWTNARAALLDALALLDASVSSRARPSDVQVTVTPPVRGEVGP